MVYVVIIVVVIVIVLQFDPHYWVMDSILCVESISGVDTTSRYPISSYCFIYPKFREEVYAPMIPIFTEWGYHDDAGKIQPCKW